MKPVPRGPELLAEIERAECPTPMVWWLGHSGFALKYRNTICYVDPYLSAKDAPFEGGQVRHASLILATRAHPRHLDPGTVPDMLAASPKAKLILPKAADAHAHSLGIPYERMVTTNADLRVEFLDDRIYAVPSASERDAQPAQLDWTPLGGYPCLGYLVRFGARTIYHPGRCVPYEGLAARLRPYNVTLALLPIGGRPGNFEACEAAELAHEIGAEWLAPMDYSDSTKFVEHMLGSRPSQRFKVFAPGEGWRLP
jgi:L-ascorbate 6-phosphate lactonase